MVSMTIDDLKRRFDYGYWANRKLFAVITELTPEQFTGDVAGSYGSIRNTLVHVLSAEWGWLERCGGPKRGAALQPGDYPTAASVIERWAVVEGYVRAFLQTLRDEDLLRVVEFTLPQTGPRAMVLGELLEHAANHAVHHRGQVSLLIRMLGRVPGNFDLVLYDADRRAIAAS
jgi:uncharacterized damage-inducible protein DinB